MRVGKPDGKEYNISGYAYQTKKTGVLKVKLNGVPVAGDYRIVKLGPQTFGEKNLYEYSVITDSTKLFLWVIARDPVKFKKFYDKEVVDFLNKNGFNRFINPIVENYHGNDCLYPKQIPANKPIVPVNKVDLKHYIGRWYQVIELINVFW